MCKSIKLDELEKEFVATEETKRNYQTTISTKISYFLGVCEDELLKIYPNESTIDIIKEMQADDIARTIHHLNNLKTNIMRGFATISRCSRIGSINYCSIVDHEYLKSDFDALRELGIDIYTGRTDLYEYITIINNEISKRIHELKKHFPDWIEFEHIKYMFKAPKDVSAEVKKYQMNKSFYPCLRHFNWINPEQNGNILSHDVKALIVIYANHGAHFNDYDKVTDASDFTKNSIYKFIEKGNKIQMFVDGENSDPYRIQAALQGLNQEELEKISVMNVYYDAIHSCAAWINLQDYVSIEVNAIPIERLKENKSLVDQNLQYDVTEAIFNGVDSVILCSSDSDFSVMINRSNASFLVMLESNKTCYAYKSSLRSNNVFYCYLDKFIKPTKNDFFNAVFESEVKRRVEEAFKDNMLNIIESAYESTRANISELEYECLVKDYMAKTTIKFNSQGVPYLAS